MSKIKNLSATDLELVYKQGLAMTDGKVDIYRQQEEVEQIDRFLPYMQYFDDENNLISEEQARKILGPEEFISGLCRSVFHGSAYREGENGQHVMFDNSKYWEQYYKRDSKSKSSSNTKKTPASK